MADRSLGGNPGEYERPGVVHHRPLVIRLNSPRVCDPGMFASEDPVINIMIDAAYLISVP
jgi:hypothetical protein